MQKNKYCHLINPRFSVLWLPGKSRSYRFTQVTEHRCFFSHSRGKVAAQGVQGFSTPVQGPAGPQHVTKMRLVLWKTDPRQRCGGLRRKCLQPFTEQSRSCFPGIQRLQWVQAPIPTSPPHPQGPSSAKLCPSHTRGSSLGTLRIQFRMESSSKIHSIWGRNLAPRWSF